MTPRRAQGSLPASVVRPSVRDAASRQGGLVTQATPGFMASVSEMTLGMMIDLARGITDSVITYRNGGDAEPRKGLEGTPPNLADPPPGCRFHPRCPLAMDVCRQVVPPMQSLGGVHRVACHAVTEGTVQ